MAVTELSGAPPAPETGALAGTLPLALAVDVDVAPAGPPPFAALLLPAAAAPAALLVDAVESDAGAADEPPAAAAALPDGACVLAGVVTRGDASGAVGVAVVFSSAVGSVCRSRSA